MNQIKILIADDSKSIREYLKEILKPVGAIITEAVNGKQAFQFIKEIEFDMVLMDIEMPEISGIEATHRVRSELGYMFTPIIMITGLQQSELIKSAFENGATDYITKPLNRTEVLSRIELRIENRRLSFELLGAKKIAEQANQYKSHFISHLAHELKTPLNAISGFTQMIQMDHDDEVTQDNCRYILEAAEHQLELINDVTNLAKIEAGIIDINLTNVELPQVIKKCFSLMKPMADKYKINLNLPRYSDAMYSLTTDPKRLKQVFMNLLSNAIKYNKPTGEVNLLINTETAGLLKIGISDTGEGIPKKDIPKLFEIFNRLGAEEKEIEGSGLGLPISRKIIELMGGKLEVQTLLGKGTTFWIVLDKFKQIHNN